MSLRKTLAHRFFNAAAASNLRRTSGENGGVRRFLHRRPVPLPPDRVPFPVVGSQLIDRLRGMQPGHLRLDGLSPPPPPPEAGITVEAARKVLRASQMEAARVRIRGIPRSCVSYSEFARVCGDGEGGREIARAMDESGLVVVLGDVVFLRPELIVGAVESMISSSEVNQRDPRRMELKEMEHTKAKIDRKAEALVKRELWCGLGFLMLQTTGFMRLTFWELSWDVMEPICFFVTSIYFMAGYAFFLRTSRDPSFEGFFESRYVAKQRRLMKTHKFDMKKFDELRKAYSFTSPRSLEQPTSSHCDCHHRSTLLGSGQ